MAAPSPLRLLCLALPVAGIVAILAAGQLQVNRAETVTATVAGGVGKPRPAKHTIPVKRVKRVAKRPTRAKPPIKRAGVQPRPKVAAPTVPNDPLWSTSWSLTKTNAAAAWNLTTGSSETVIAVLDTGVDLSHPDLQGSFVQGYDIVNRDDDPSDDHGHGTMVAGVIAARANNGLGGVGVCSRCSVMPVKVIAANGSGDVANVAEGIVWAVDHGARVLNLSFVFSGPDDGVAHAIEYARSRGAVVVAAAGNAGSSEAAYPAAYPGVVSVTSTDPADLRYAWASHGSWVKLAAPGCSQTTAPNAGYGDFCGTSSSTAFVSGLAGLALSLASDRSVEGIEQALAANAVPVGDIVSAGRVNAAGMLGALRAAPAVSRP